MRILILGGTGAMGVHLSRLLRYEHDVYVTSRGKGDTEKGINYLKGNAKDKEFLQKTLSLEWDSIVDFMVYNTEEFKERIQLFLKGTRHYFFLSSSRVFSNREEWIKESSPRILDVSADKEYLETDEYALSKARQEDLLFQNSLKNWTIIRPYITYSENRLQLGTLEKEEWLYRALKGRPVVFCEELMGRYTTMTYGLNVAEVMGEMIGKEETKGKAFNITHSKNITWADVLNVYTEAINTYTGKETKIRFLSLTDFLKCKPNKYQVIYDRMYDRKFDNTAILPYTTKTNWIEPENGLKKCIAYLLMNPDFLRIDWYWEAQKDRLSKSYVSLSELQGVKSRLKYIKYRFLR